MDIFDDFASRARRYLNDDSAPVYPQNSAIAALTQFDEELQDSDMEAGDVLNMLDAIGSPGTVRSAGGRYFGFVTGGSLPASLAAKLMAAVWDQNSALYMQSPVAATLEEISARWLLSLFGLPTNSGVGFTTGATMANFTALLAARHQLLKNVGWDAESNGLFNAPEITVITGLEVHTSLLRALNLCGFGRDRIIKVPVDAQGRVIVDKIPLSDGPTIVCAQAGNVNTGAFDDIGGIAKRINKINTWLHVDAAFGLWAAASPKLKHLTVAIEEADSLATDAHKWLNVPYDCGIVFVKNKEALVNAVSSSAAYLPTTDRRESFQFVPEMSREARGITVWAALKSLGKKGLANLIERNCTYAKRFAEGLKDAGFTILNDVVLNQAMVSFGDAEATLQVIKAVQDDGTCWCGVTTWQGHTAMRISVSSWATTEEDVNKSIDAIVGIAKRIRKQAANEALVDR